MDYEQYYKESRGYNWHDILTMRLVPRVKAAKVPAIYGDQFKNLEEYNSWLEEKRKQYFG